MPAYIRNIIIMLIVVTAFVAFTALYADEIIHTQDVILSDNHFSSYDAYIEKAQFKINLINEKIKNGTATIKDYVVREYYKSRIEEAEEEKRKEHNIFEDA